MKIGDGERLEDLTLMQAAEPIDPLTNSKRT
jgi:hypothetical protein